MAVAEQLRALFVAATADHSVLIKIIIFFFGVVHCLVAHRYSIGDRAAMATTKAANRWTKTASGAVALCVRATGLVGG